MKTLIFLLFISPKVLFAQKEGREIHNPNRLPDKTYTLPSNLIAPAEINLPFSKIEIIDNRFDTSKIGFVPKKLIIDRKNIARKMIYKNGLANELNTYYKDFYSNAFSKNDIKLLIVIKKLWFSGINNEKNKEIDIAENNYATSFLYLKWEYYLRKGDILTPIKRIDTIVNGIRFATEEKNESGNHSNNKILKLIFDGMIEVFDFTLAVKNIDRLPKQSWKQMEDFNKSYFDIPVLKDSAIKEGVFLSFKEFKNNTPSIINFKEKKIRYQTFNTENYLEDDKGNRITNYWGYCKEGVVRIGKYGNDKLYRKNNTFEYFNKYQNIYGTTNAFGGNGAREKEIWIPYQLDMETGNIY